MNASNLEEILMVNNPKLIKFEKDSETKISIVLII